MKREHTIMSAYLKTTALITSGVVGLVLMLLKRCAISLALMRIDIRVSTLTSKGATTTPCCACVHALPSGQDVQELLGSQRRRSIHTWAGSAWQMHTEC